MNATTLHNRLSRLPMLKAFIPFAAGIVLAEYYTLPTLFVWAGSFVLLGVALAMRSTICTLAALLLFGWGLSELRQPPSDDLPRGRRIECRVQVGDDALGTITAWRDTHTRSWREADVQIVLWSDSTLTLRPGERLIVRSYLNELPEGSYGRLMQRRGYAGRMWLSERQLLMQSDPRRVSLHAAASAHLAGLGLPEREQALCAAMVTGDRRGLTPEMRTTYARSGTSHLLAVSGLHVGIVFLLVNALLWWLPVVRRGHLWRNLAAIALIWLYATMAGLSPSVVRAAIMFSALQLSLASTSAYVSGNTLAATAFIMLLYRPAYLFDISFQLSFIAVAAILAWGIPLCRWMHSRYRGLNFLTDTVAIGIVSAVATAPLAAHTFGIVSIIGIAVNPLAIPLATLVVLSTVIWMLLPLSALAFIPGTIAKWQNNLTEQAAALPGGAFEWTPSTLQTAGIYLVMAIFTLLAWSHEAKKPLPLER